MATTIIDLAPQPSPAEHWRSTPWSGPQECALSSPADLVIAGGAAGGGKTFFLELDPVHHLWHPSFNAVLFRRELTRIKRPGGLWDASRKIYPYVPDQLGGPGTPVPGIFTWRFPSGSQVAMHHLQNEGDEESWSGAEVPWFGFDQLEEFAENQFWFMFSRNRWPYGRVIRPAVRGTCNPAPDTWLADLVSWWIGDDGFPLLERAGTIRYFARPKEELHWGSTVDEVYEKVKGYRFKREHIKSMCFVPSTLDDNVILQKGDPGYEANLLSMNDVDTMRLRWGNWKVKPSAGLFFNEANFKIMPIEEWQAIQRYQRPFPTVRAWDLAATKEQIENPKTSFTASAKISRIPDGRVVISHARKGQWDAFQRDQEIVRTAIWDGHDTTIWYEQEPGSGGKADSVHLLTRLASFEAYFEPSAGLGSKLERAKPMASGVKGGTVYVVDDAHLPAEESTNPEEPYTPGKWVRPYLQELHRQPAIPNDYMDASSKAYNKAVESAPVPLGSIPAVKG